MTAHLPRFAIAAPAAVGDVVTLAGDEARHARVRRLAVGEAVALSDERGHSCIGEVQAVRRDQVAVRVTAVNPLDDGESALDLTLAIGLLKADKLDWVIEKATELGVTRIQPFASTHTLAQPSAARRTRWQQVARSAAKQCGRSRVPAVAAPCPLATVLTGDATRLLLAEHGATVALAAVEAAPPITLIVGAEGGFSEPELATARASGALLIGLGRRILRAETAAIAAVALCQARWGDL
ncbi:16S rRNA (uracil(1498)-N(3))-methyltransferase [bacterium]|nr:16S rRNA (uracil(1498)-N(3))-methyltransferase [bacterium]